MKKLIPLFILVLLSFSCKKEVPVTNPLDGMEVVLEQYSDLEMISSDTLIVKEMQFSVDANSFPDGVYYVMSNDTLAPLDLLVGLLLYVDEYGAWGKLDAGQVILGGNAQNDAYQLFRSRLKALDIKTKEFYATNREFFRLLELGDQELDVNTYQDVFDQYLLYLEDEQNIFYNYFSENLNTPLGEEVFLHYLESGTLARFPASDLMRLIKQSGNESLLNNPRFIQ